MVLLLSNYPFDEQESMQRFARVLERELRKRNIEVETLFPRPFFGRLRKSTTGVGKWLGYLDKFALFPFVLRRKLRGCDVVHICDHSNAFYGRHIKNRPWLATCHDMLAARGALGEQTDCPATRTGKILQQWILGGLALAPLIVCDSTATQQDVQRLLAPSPRTRVILLGLNHDFKPLPAEVRQARLAALPALRKPFLLHVGSAQRRKNRAGVMRVFKKLAGRWDAQLVFAGKPLSDEQAALAGSLGIMDRVVSVTGADNDLLEALYNGATALLFPSSFEGFGWPIIEAQACGCPVLCSNSGPLPEVAGDGALIRNVEDEEGFAEDVLRMTDPVEREKWVRRGFANLQRFTTDRMMDGYIQAYEELAKKRL